MPRFPLALLLLSAAPLLAQPRFVVEKTVTDTVVGTATFDITQPNIKAKEWILFAAVAPEHDGQRGVKTTMTPAGTAMKEPGEGRAVLRARVPVSDRKNLSALKASVTHEVTLYQRTLRELRPEEAAPKVAPLTAAERKRYLAPTTQLDFEEPAFRMWAEKLPQKGDPMEFARTAFEVIRKSATYDYDPDQVRIASAICRKPKTDCGGMSSLFAAAMRWKGIPARVLTGRWARSADGAEKLNDTVYYQWHVVAEFFADGIGWVPVDVSQAVIAKDEGTAKWHFGNDRGDFLTFHIGTDLKFDSVHFGTVAVSFVQGIPFWIKGDGSLDGMEMKQSWTVKKK